MFFVSVMHLHGEVVRLGDGEFTITVLTTMSLKDRDLLTLSLKCSLFLLCTSMVKWSGLGIGSLLLLYLH